MEPVKTSSFQLPSSETVEIVIVRLKDGTLAPRALHELIPRPTPPPSK